MSLVIVVRCPRPPPRPRPRPRPPTPHPPCAAPAECRSSERVGRGLPATEWNSDTTPSITWTEWTPGARKWKTPAADYAAAAAAAAAAAPCRMRHHSELRSFVSNGFNHFVRWRVNCVFVSGSSPLTHYVLVSRPPSTIQMICYKESRKLRAPTLLLLSLDAYMYIVTLPSNFSLYENDIPVIGSATEGWHKVRGEIRRNFSHAWMGITCSLVDEKERGRVGFMLTVEYTQPNMPSPLSSSLSVVCICVWQLKLNRSIFSVTCARRKIDLNLDHSAPSSRSCDRLPTNHPLPPLPTPSLPLLSP